MYQIMDSHPDIIFLNTLNSVFEIRFFLCAPAGCKDPKNGAPGHSFMCYLLYKHTKQLGKPCTHRVHRFQNPCTRQPKCAHRVQGAYIHISHIFSIFAYTNNKLYCTGRPGGGGYLDVFNFDKVDTYITYCITLASVLIFYTLICEII